MNPNSNSHNGEKIPLLEVRNIGKYYDVSKGLFGKSKTKLHALDDISFQLDSGKTLGIIGESGSGKSTLGKIIVKLLEPTQGEIIFQGTNVTHFNEKQFRPYRKEIQIIFQDPYSNLNPKFPIKKILSEPFEIHNLYPDVKERIEVIENLLNEVGINPKNMNKFPHEFSGGQKQRIGIARALALKPKLIVCDEPVSALDVSIQSQIINLLMDLKEKYSLSLVFIAHNLAVVEQISDDVAVMYLGKLVEYGSVEQIFQNPSHAYTKTLLESVPKMEVKKRHLP